MRANIAAHRKALGLTLREVSERLATAGRPLSHTSVSDIENGSRRVDVDDLVAISYVLQVNPHALLFPRVGIKNGKPDGSHVTGLGDIESESLWEWADGALPLYDPDEDPRGFTGKTRPSWSRTVGEVETDESTRKAVLDMRLQVMTALDSVQTVLESIADASDEGQSHSGSMDLRITRRRQSADGDAEVSTPGFRD